MRGPCLRVFLEWGFTVVVVDAAVVVEVVVVVGVVVVVVVVIAVRATKVVRRYQL